MSWLVAARAFGSLSMDLDAELSEVHRTFSADSVNFPDGVGAHGRGARLYHRGYWVIARYAPDHPFSPPWVYIDPPPNSSHYYVHGNESYARLCWCRREQWDTSFHLIVALGAAMTFLNEELG